MTVEAVLWDFGGVILQAARKVFTMLCHALKLTASAPGITGDDRKALHIAAVDHFTTALQPGVG